MRLPADPPVWEQLAEHHDVRVYYGLHLDAWNRGFDLSPATVHQLEVLRAAIGFDIYADTDDD